MRGRFVLGFDDSAISGVCRHDTNREESVATLAAQPRRWNVRDAKGTTT
jgi:hypothetical protein